MMDPYTTLTDVTDAIVIAEPALNAFKRHNGAWRMSVEQRASAYINHTGLAGNLK